MSEIAIIGAGAWGTGIAIVLGRKGTHRIRLWAHEADVCESIMKKRLNEKFLPGRPIPQSVTASNGLGETLRGAEIVVSVMPSQHCRALFERMRPLVPSHALIVSATKGLEEGTLLRMTEVITQVMKHADGSFPAVGALSGPSFAQEAARGDPTAITIASQDDGLVRTVQQEFSDSSFRVYTNSDVDRRGTGRSAEEHCGHRSGDLRRSGFRAQLGGGAHHAGLGGNDSPGGGLRRTR